ncbi:MAG TPA: FtsQ-type POTRA domain-containing protein [Opitutales bacterium]|nr:FtsQ-type POTRA domain-containing protein [Opitutales bacterium]
MPEETKDPAESRQTRREWSDIQQDDTRRSTTEVARRRKWSRIGRIVSLCLLALVICGALIFAYVSASRNDAALEPSAFLEKVTFRTDGVLNDRWLARALDIREGMAMNAIDIASVRRKLEASGQIRTAAVTLRLPRELVIEVRERMPILRAQAEVGQGKVRTLLISSDGTIFEGSDYPVNSIRALPYVDGVVFRRRGEGYEPVQNIGPIADMLSTTRTNWPKLYADWQVVSLKRYRGLEQGSIVEVKSKTLGRLQFTPDNVDNQLRRLFGIITNGATRDPRKVVGVNLTIPGQAIVEYSATEKSGAQPAPQAKPATPKPASSKPQATR